MKAQLRWVGHVVKLTTRDYQRQSSLSWHLVQEIQAQPCAIKTV